jgi:hypothetical protein
MWAIYDHVDRDGENVIAKWARGLENTQRKKLRAKLDMLTQAGPDLPTQLLSHTGVAHIYKLRVTGNVQLRPMLCKGPIDNESEFTLLLGAIEVGNRLKPSDAAEIAAAIREEVIVDPNNRRCAHERID